MAECSLHNRPQNHGRAIRADLEWDAHARQSVALSGLFNPAGYLYDLIRGQGEHLILQRRARLVS